MSKLYLRKDIADHWGDLDPFVQVDRMQGRVYRAVAARRTLRVKILGQPFFLKRHHGVGWVEIFKNLLTLRWPVLGAGTEFRAARALSAAGVSVPEPVAYAESGDNPASRESFLLSVAIEPNVSLEELAQGWLQAPPPARQRWRLVQAVADTVAGLHAAGVNHRDLYICHFLLRPDSLAKDPELTLIDLHRAQVRAVVPRRWLLKDLGALWFSAADAKPTRRDAYRFIRRYAGRSLRAELGEPERLAFWLAVGERASRLHAEARRKQLPVLPDPFDV